MQMQNSDNQHILLSLITDAKNRALRGEHVSVADAMAIADGVAASVADIENPEAWTSGPLAALCNAADEVRLALHGDVIDTCSIINGRSGRCTENCKWCSQAGVHHTGCKEYDFVPEEEYFSMLRANSDRGVQRFSIVCSGRKVAMKDLRVFADIYRRSRQESDIYLCASMGLLNREELQALYDAGVRRYHCNIETSARYFPELCTTHTREDKLRTIRLAREVGMEICSGGIIGMGETMRDRLEMAEEAREAGACSIPVNLLNPIAGTPLENTPLIGEGETILTVALMRLVAPKCVLRFAGGRARLSPEATARILRGGMNGAMIGDLLTTIGNQIDADYALFRSLGWKLSPAEEQRAKTTID